MKRLMKEIPRQKDFSGFQTNRTDDNNGDFTKYPFLQKNSILFSVSFSNYREPPIYLCLQGIGGSFLYYRSATHDIL